MIIFKRMLNLYRFSYFPLAVLAGLLVAMVFTGGCDRQAQSGALGSLAGIAQLSAPDATTGHAGILVFLAGTPYQARTDQQGRYRIDGIPAGTYDLVAEKDGYQGQVIQDLLVNPATNTPEQPLQPSSPMLTRIAAAAPTTSTAELGTIKGVAYLDGMDVNENGGIRVEVNGTAFVTVSSNEGQYRILNVEPGTYALSYYKDGYRPFTTEDISVTTGVTEVPVVALELVQAGDKVSAASAAAAAAIKATAPAEAEAAPPGPDEIRNIVGLVDFRDAQNQPITDYSNVTVAINGTDQVAEVNDQGQFRIDNLTSGTYTLIGAVSDGPVVQLPVDLETQRTATVTLKLGGPAAAGAQAGGIKGKVVLLDPDEKPIPDASGVQVAVNGTQVIATTTADGTFTLKGVDPGTYTVSATKDTFEPAEVSDVAVTGAAPVDVGEIRMAMKVDRPRVLSTAPANNAKDVEVAYDLPIIIKFSDRMDGASVREAIKLSPSTPFTTAIGKGSDPAADDNTLVIRLSNEDEKAPIQFGATYRVTIADTAANMTGITMAEPYSFIFRTANPGVIQVYPENGAQRVIVDQLNYPVLFTFNTRLDPDSINDRNIRVKPDSGVSVSTTYTDSEQKGWTTVRVATQWQPNTLYTVTVSRRVKAFNGQPLGNTPYTLRFRTAPLEIMSVPVLTTR